MEKLERIGQYRPRITFIHAIIVALEKDHGVTAKEHSHLRGTITATLTAPIPTTE